jgi:hypothetical protein
MCAPTKIQTNNSFVILLKFQNLDSIKLFCKLGCLWRMLSEERHDGRGLKAGRWTLGWLFGTFPRFHSRTTLKRCFVWKAKIRLSSRVEEARLAPNWILPVSASNASRLCFRLRIVVWHHKSWSFLSYSIAWLKSTNKREGGLSREHYVFLC